MEPMGVPPPEIVGWARKVNSRWIVHHGLRESAQAYLDHLAACDPGRLLKSCERAQRLVHQCEGEDPKPWFYAGLFSLVTPEEALRFLDRHWFTASCIPALASVDGVGVKPDGVGPETEAKARRLRDAVAGLP